MSVQRRHGVSVVAPVARLVGVAILWTFAALESSSPNGDAVRIFVDAFRTQTIRHHRRSSWSIVRIKTESICKSRACFLQGQLYLLGDGDDDRPVLDDSQSLSHQEMPSSTSRRAWIRNQVIRRVRACAAVAAVTAAATTTATTTPAAASTTTASLPTTVLSKNGSAAATTTLAMSTSWTDIRQSLQDATDTLDKLVQNWQRAVVDCTYADVPRDLLEQRNKELLLEKASTFALFDKSVSIVSCKTVVNTVRDYLGRTGIGPVAKLEATLQLAVTKLLQSDDDNVDVEDVERILTLVDDIRTTLIRADSLSYAARRDYTALNNFAPDLATSIITDATSNLFQCQSAIQEAVTSLTRLLSLLPR